MYYIYITVTQNIEGPEGGKIAHFLGLADAHHEKVAG
jgi:hypothetical protein